MKLFPLDPNPEAIYHYFQKSFTEAVLYSDDLKTVCYGTPTTVSKFIAKFLKKTNSIYYYHNRFSDNKFVYELSNMYVGISVAEEMSEEKKTENNNGGPQKSESKPK